MVMHVACKTCDGEGYLPVSKYEERRITAGLYRLPPNYCFARPCPDCGGKNGRAMRSGRIYDMSGRPMRPEDNR